MRFLFRSSIYIYILILAIVKKYYLAIIKNIIKIFHYYFIYYWKLIFNHTIINTLDTMVNNHNN